MKMLPLRSGPEDQVTVVKPADLSFLMMFNLTPIFQYKIRVKLFRGNGCFNMQQLCNCGHKVIEQA